jgi:hypothetical protein
MIARKNRSARGQSRQQLGLIIGLAVCAYYAYQNIAIYHAPNLLLNKDFVCGKGAFTRSKRSLENATVYGSQNPNTLIAWHRVDCYAARATAPDTAIHNENERNRLWNTHELVDLSPSGKDESWSQLNSPLVVHVLDTDNRAKDVPLLVVRPLNKCHKGETWYIDATSINPAANVTGFADVAGKAHKFGVMDVVENKDAQKAFNVLKHMSH